MQFYCFLLLLLLFPFSVSAQTRVVTPAPTATPSKAADGEIKEDNEVLRIDTEEVSLNVRVLDSRNRPVKNLNIADFRVYENEELQTITSLTTAEIQTNYALVIDNSRSLRTQLVSVIEAAKTIVSRNRPIDKTTIVRFVSPDKIEIVRDFTVNKNLIEESLNNLFIEGGRTAIIDAVFLTAKRVAEYERSGKKDDPKRRALIVVSDGDDRASLYGERELIDFLRKSDVQIYAVGFVSALSNEPEPGAQQSRQAKARAFLIRLAEETGGKVYFPDSLAEMPQIANDISSELRTQYLITYAPSEAATGRGDFRNIKVTVRDGANKEKRFAVTRSGRSVSNNQ